MREPNRKARSWADTLGLPALLLSLFILAFMLLATFTSNRESAAGTSGTPQVQMWSPGTGGVYLMVYYPEEKTIYSYEFEQGQPVKCRAGARISTPGGPITEVPCQPKQ
jgi:hypothetical protein